MTSAFPYPCNWLLRFVSGILLSLLLYPAGLMAAAFKYKDSPGDMKWPNGRIFYTFKSDVITAEREEFERAARAWQKVANLNFQLTYESNETLHQSPAGNYLLVQRNYIGRDVNFAFVGRCGSFT
ncbi:MAG: hypothetical protein H7Y36_02840, partial [Armatimonadetes bacterium]|nr:hypothetical protein [Akkermansiaceae bacterium]